MSFFNIEVIIQIILVLFIFYFSIKKEKLTLGGGYSALFIGTVISFAGYEYMIILFSFFISSIKATDIHKKIKFEKLGKTYSKESKRTSYQVLCKGLYPSLICLIIYCLNSGKLLLLDVFDTELDFIKFLYGSYIGFFCSANADTWASELGINSSNDPILLINFNKVPKGINGAVSVYGTICSILGGLFITFMTVLSCFLRYNITLMNYDINDIIKVFLKVFLIGGFIGFIGSLIDSFLGEIMQVSYYDINKKWIVDRGDYEKMIKNKENYIKVYGTDVLNNSQINLITGIITSIFSGILFTYIL